MNKSVALPFAVIILASIIAGCGASGNVATSAATPAPTPSTPCTSPPGYTIQQVFPQNGLGGQANLQGVVFAIGPSPLPNAAAPSPLPTNWFFYVALASGSSAPAISSYPASIGILATPVPAPGASAGATPTPLPTPSDTINPAFAGNYIFETASNGTFANSAQFTVYLANTTCYPGIPESTFSTAPTDLPSPQPTATST